MVWEYGTVLTESVDLLLVILLPPIISSIRAEDDVVDVGEETKLVDGACEYRVLVAVGAQL